MSSSLSQLCASLNWLSSSLSLVSSSLNLVSSSMNLFSSSLNLVSSYLNLVSSSLNLVSSSMNLVSTSLSLLSLFHPFQATVTSTGCLVSNRLVWFDELGMWSKVLDGPAGEFAVLPAILCGPELEQNWIPPLWYVAVVYREGLTAELMFIQHTWKVWVWRGSMVRGAI